MFKSHFCPQILTEQVCTQVVHKPHPEPDSTVKIQNPSKICSLTNSYCPNASCLLLFHRALLSSSSPLLSDIEGGGHPPEELQSQR